MQARKVLERVRGLKNVDQEFNDIVESVELAKAAQTKRWALFTSRRYRGQAVRSPSPCTHNSNTDSCLLSWPDLPKLHAMA